MKPIIFEDEEGAWDIDDVRKLVEEEGRLHRTLLTLHGLLYDHHNYDANTFEAWNVLTKALEGKNEQD